MDTSVVSWTFVANEHICAPGTEISNRTTGLTMNLCHASSTTQSAQPINVEPRVQCYESIAHYSEVGEDGHGFYAQTAAQHTEVMSTT